MHNEDVLYICCTRQVFLCYKCVISSKTPIQSKSLVVYHANTISAVASALLKKSHEKHLAVEKALNMFDTQKPCPKDSLLESISHGSSLFTFEDISQLGEEGAIVLQALTRKPFYLRVL